MSMRGAKTSTTSGRSSRPAAVDCQRSAFASTASALNGEPSWKSTPTRSRKVQIVASPEVEAPRASPGTRRVSPNGPARLATSGSWICRVRSCSALVSAASGSMSVT